MRTMKNILSFVYIFFPANPTMTAATMNGRLYMMIDVLAGKYVEGSETLMLLNSTRDFSISIGKKKKEDIPRPIQKGTSKSHRVLTAI